MLNFISPQPNKKIHPSIFKNHINLTGTINHQKNNQISWEGRISKNALLRWKIIATLIPAHTVDNVDKVDDKIKSFETLDYNKKSVS